MTEETMGGHDRAKLSERERSILSRAAESVDGWTYLNASDGSAAVHLTALGLGHWEQTSPFVARFQVNAPARNQAGAEGEGS